MSVELRRAELLRERGRHEEAIAVLMSHLALEPEDPRAFIELTLNRLEVPEQLREALSNARTAVGLMPEDAYPRSLEARVLYYLDRNKEALVAAEAAIALEPEFGHAWVSKSLALLGMSRWKEAEASAREALGIDPEDVSASNLLSHALLKQNRLDESDAEVKRRLARDPEDAFSFANGGWAALQRGEVAVAEGYFREALRLEPGMEHAREGLKSAYRARSWFYRVFLKWAFFMQRLSGGNQLAITIGVLVGFKVLRAVAASIHPLLVIPIALAYYVFLFGSWLAVGLANFILLKDPVARLSLDRMEKVEAGVIGGLFFGGLVAVAAGLAMGSAVVAVVGAVMVLAALPATMVLTNPSKVGRVVFGGIFVAVLVLGVVLAVDLGRHAGRGIFEGTAGSCAVLILLLVAGSSWLGMIDALRKGKPGEG